MRRLPLLLILLAPALAAGAPAVEDVSRAVPQIIIPGAAIGLGGAAPSLIIPSAVTPSLSLPPQGIILPTAAVIQAPAPKIVTAARAMTEAEAAPAAPLSQAALAELAKSLSPEGDAQNAAAADAGRGRALDAAFDGTLAPEAKAWDDVSSHFSQGPKAPALPVVETAARSLIARLLPSFYRRVPVTSAYDRGERPSTGHTWTPERGHVIELAPVRADARGEVASAFGQARVQQKIEHLMEYSHEYFHVLFDSAVGRKADHAPHSAYAALTEGFAVSGEQLLIERLLDMAPLLGLGPRDTMDLAAVARARRDWLDTEDTHYAEGMLSWRQAYQDGGTSGLLSFLASLSARRMAAVPRSDPAYQLALGDPKLLSAYLGSGETSPARRGMYAFAKAARGEALTPDETREAAAAVEQAGPDAWRRLFDRTLLADKRLKNPDSAAPSGEWWEKKKAPAASPQPAFAAASLSPAAGAALARYLADTIRSSDGGARLFGRRGPNETLTAILAGAETLPWDQAGRQVWDAGVTRWLMGR